DVCAGRCPSSGKYHIAPATRSTTATNPDRLPKLPLSRCSPVTRPPGIAAVRARCCAPAQAKVDNPFALGHGEERLSCDRHLGAEDLAVQRIGDVERLALESDVGHQPMRAPGVDEMRGQAIGVEAPTAPAEAAHNAPAL